MAVFGNYIVENSDMGYESFLPDVDAESLMMDESVEPCQEDNFLVAGARVCAECTENMNRIMEACAIQEFCYFEENGTEMVYEGGALTSFIEKAKAWFLKLWQKIQGIFKKAIMVFSSKAKEDKAFVSKYEKELTKATHADYGDTEVSIYKYVFYSSFKNLDAVDTTLSTTCVADWKTEIPRLAKVEDLTDQLESIKGKDKVEPDGSDKDAMSKIRDYMSTINESDWKDDWKDKERGKLVQTIDSNADSEITSSEFNKAIAEACQGDSTKDSVNLSDAVNLAVPYLKESKDIITSLDKWLRSWKKSIDNQISALTKAQRELDRTTSNKSTKDGDARVAAYEHTLVSTAISLDEAKKTIGVTFHSAVINQIKACSGQSKAICVKAVHYKKPKHESYAYTEESTGSLLDNTVLL